MILGVLFVSCLAFYGLSHRLFLAYVHAVSHEERWSRLDRRRHTPKPIATAKIAPPIHHIGPKCFFVLDLLLLAVSLTCLWQMFEIESSSSLWQQVLGSFALFSVVATLWLIRAGSHIRVYYQQMLRAVRGPRATGTRSGPARRLRRALLALSVSWAAVPLVLLFLGRDEVAIPHGSTMRCLALFLVWFVLPQLVLALAIVRDLWPMRRFLYRG